VRHNVPHPKQTVWWHTPVWSRSWFDAASYLLYSGCSSSPCYRRHLEQKMASDELASFERTKAKKARKLEIKVIHRPRPHPLDESIEKLLLDHHCA
jgi:hypothetical protein